MFNNQYSSVEQKTECTNLPSLLICTSNYCSRRVRRNKRPIALMSLATSKISSNYNKRWKPKERVSWRLLVLFLPFQDTGRTINKSACDAKLKGKAQKSKAICWLHSFPLVNDFGDFELRSFHLHIRVRHQRQSPGRW